MTVRGGFCKRGRRHSVIFRNLMERLYFSSFQTSRELRAAGRGSVL
jgi:hypothetical protein